MLTRKRLVFAFWAVAATFTVNAQDYAKVWLDSKGKIINDSTQASRYAVVLEETPLIKVNVYRPNGQLTETSEYLSFNKVQRIRQGERKVYYRNGSDSLIVNYSNNKRTGECSVFYPDGAKHSIRHFKDNKLEGSFIQYYPDGSLRREEIYAEGKCKGGKLYDTEGAELPHQPYERPASFKGGTKNFMQLVRDNVRYTWAQAAQGDEGRVVLSFTIETDGTMTDLCVLESKNETLSVEALKGLTKVAKKYKWSPYFVDGDFKKTKMNLPLNFIIPN